MNQKKLDHLFCIDVWNSPGSVDNVFLTTPFQNVLFPKDFTEKIEDANPKCTHVFKVKIPLLKNYEAICLIGNCESLGNWSTHQPVLLNKSDGNWWIAEVELIKKQSEVHYKYGVYDIN